MIRRSRHQALELGRPWRAVENRLEQPEQTLELYRRRSVRREDLLGGGVTKDVVGRDPLGRRHFRLTDVIVPAADQRNRVATGEFGQHRLDQTAPQGFGQSLVYRYLYDDRVVATDLCIHRDGTLFILKTTYDEAERATSPAQLMRNEAFRTFFDDGRFTTIELYGRVMDWHTKLTDDVRTMYHINCYRYGLMSRLHKPEATDAASRYAS